MRLGAIDAGHLERYLAHRRAEGYAPRSCNRHLNLLHSIYGAAEKRGLVTANPVRLVDRPREPRKRWTILAPEEVGRVARAFTELLAAETDEFERVWLSQARVVFLTVVGGGLRRGEVLAFAGRMFASPTRPARSYKSGRHSFAGRSRRRSRKRGADDRARLKPRRRALRAPRAVDVRRRRREGVLPPADGRPARSQALRGHAQSRACEGRDREADAAFPRRPAYLDHERGGSGHPTRHALLARAGHSDYSTTQTYIDLAGVSFRDEAIRA